MADYMLLMHDDAQPGDQDWDGYLARLRAGGCFQGGSAVGGGASFRKAGEPGAISARISGFIRITADSLEAAQGALDGNPVYEAGGTVEIRELSVTG